MSDHKFYVLCGRHKPMFLSDETEFPTAFYTLKEAHAAIKRSLMCRAWGYAIVEWNEGFVGINRDEV